MKTDEQQESTNVGKSLPIPEIKSDGWDGQAEWLGERVRDESVNGTDDYGWTPLHEAAIGGHTEIVGILKQHKK